MSFLSLKFFCLKSEVEIIELLLEDFEVSSYSLSDAKNNPFYEPLPLEFPLWEQILVNALFDSKKDLTDLEAHIAKYNTWGFSVESLEDLDWVRNYQKNFTSILYGSKLRVIPTWDDEIYSEGEQILTLDPGLAFGSGTHETTHLCMEYVDANPPLELDVIDYGCGSGILSIAAALLGAKRVFSIDHDPQAILATEENAKRNNVLEKIFISNKYENITWKADLILANIFCNVLIEIKQNFLSLLKQNGKIVFSGIKSSQLKNLELHYQDFLKIEGIKQKGDWLLVEMIRKC